MVAKRRKGIHKKRPIWRGFSGVMKDFLKLRRVETDNPSGFL
jgi:hypothetical protein